MKVYHHFKEVGRLNQPVVTAGTFDGVHKGHQQILSHIRELADNSGGETLLFTFYPHPRMVLHPKDHGLELLNSQEEKIKLLERFGIDHLVIHPFTKDFSRLTAVEYVRDVLVNCFQTKKLVIGYDHHFGRNREGSFQDLVEFGPLYGFEVKEIPAQEIDSVNVSSTKTRHALKEGDIVTANKYLGYQYPLGGKVLHGAKLGRTLGFPTANLQISDPLKLVPADGVYAVKVLLGGQRLDGMLNIGVKPTVSEEAPRSIEVNIFNFEGDLYGQSIHLELVARIREEFKFDNLDQLKEQLNSDRKKAIKLLAP